MSKLPRQFRTPVLFLSRPSQLYCRWARWRRLPFGCAGALSAALLLSLMGGCKQLELPPGMVAACQDLQLCERPSPPPVLTDIGCDVTQGAPCSKETLSETVNRVAAYSAERPGSRMRLWMLSGTVGATRMVAEQLMPPLSAKGPKSRTESINRLVAATRELFLTAGQPAFAAPPPRQSPLVESLAKIGLADSYGLARRVVLITDARQVSSDSADFECSKRLPSEAEWVQLLAKRRLLPLGSLARFAITISYLTGAPAERCTVSVARELALRALWEAALKHAGVQRVTFLSGPVVMDDESTPAHGSKE